MPGRLIRRQRLRRGRFYPSLLLQQEQVGESSLTVRNRTCKARQRQLARQGCTNAALPNDAVISACQLPAPQRRWLEDAASRLQLSARALHSTLRVARTIADLAPADEVTREHLGEALAFRNPLLQQ